MHAAFPRRLLLFAQKSFIVTHQQLAFQCFYDIQCNANHDDQCRTTEANIHFEDPLQHNRHHSQDCVADCANQCDSAYHSGDISAGGLTRSDTRDEATGTFCVESARTEEKIPLDQRISALASASDELYSINNRSTDPETGRTIWSLDSLVAEEELLLSSNVIDGPAANRSVVTWRNFTPERPILYLREEDCFTVFLEDEIAYNTYLLGDDWGILICSHDDAPTTYYRFSRAAEK